MPKKRLYSIRLDIELIEFLKSLPNASEKIRELIKLMRDIEMKEFDREKTESEVVELDKNIERLRKQILIAETILDEGLEVEWDSEDGKFEAVAKDRWDMMEDGQFHIAKGDDEGTALRRGTKTVQESLKEWKAALKELSISKERRLFRLKAAGALKE